MTPTPGQQFERLSDEIGGAGALALCAFAGHRGQVYVPQNEDDKHVFSRVLGKKAFGDLVQAFSGQYIQLPNIEASITPLRRAGLVHDFHTAGTPTRLIAASLRCTRQNVARILRDLDGVGPIEATVSDNDEPAEVQHAAA